MIICTACGKPIEIGQAHYWMLNLIKHAECATDEDRAFVGRLMAMTDEDFDIVEDDDDA